MENRPREIEIVDATIEDLNRICEIYSESFKYTEPKIAQWHKILSDKNTVYRVAKIDGIILGVASLITINKILRSGSRMGLIEDVAVSTEARGTGVGKALIENLLQESVVRKCYKTILNCSDENIAFYEKCGMHRAENQMRWDRPKNN